MRYTMLSGPKRATVTDVQHKTHVVVHRRNQYSSVEPLKFVLIRSTGATERGEVHLPLGDIKKSTRRLRPIERKLRKWIRAEHRALGEYLLLHERSRRKRRNGWARDLKSNLVKVIRHNT
jgi:uncharacterized protein DUF6312